VNFDLADPRVRENLHWSREKARCEGDFDYLARTYLRIKSKNVIGFPLLRFNRVQRYLHGKVEDQLKRSGFVRQAWAKARQVGASTYIRARSLHQTGFKNNRNAFLLTHDEPTSYELFDFDQTYYDALPQPLQPMTKHRSKTRMHFSGRNSKILIGHALNYHVGASQMNHIWHLTELARYRNPEQIQASLFPTFSSATGADYSMGMLESTSRFGGVWWKDFWEASRRGETEYEAHFVPWSMHEDYSSPIPKNFQVTHEEKDLMRKHALTLGNIVWRRAKRAEFRTNPALFQHEYPLTWEESWQLPKGTLRMFDEATLVRISREIRPGTRMNVESSGLKAGMTGPIEVWEIPQPDVFYHLGCDISEARTKDADWTALEIIRRDTLEQVAECRVRVDPASPAFIDLVYWLGAAYNFAEINPDITGGWGMALMSELQRRSYPNLWRWRRRDDAKERISQRVGFLFTARDKKYLVGNAVLLAVSGKPVIHSEALKDEIRDYLNIGVDEYGAAPGAFDDTVSAWMLALLAARDEQTEFQEGTPTKEPDKPPRYLVHDVDADLQPEGHLAAIDMRPWR
jgi:hypothetical protein